MTYEKLAEKIADELFDSGYTKIGYQTLKLKILTTLIKVAPSPAIEMEKALMLGIRD